MENFKIIKPSPALEPYVHYYWSLQAGSEVPAGNRIIPTGSISLIFHRADLLKSTINGSFQPRAFISGITTNYSDVISTGALDMLVVVFRPHGSAPFLNIPLEEFHNLDVAADDTGDNQLIELSGKILNEPSDELAIAYLEHFLLSRLSGKDNYNHRRIEAVIQAINRNVNINVSEAADIACVSRKQFNRIFSAQVGVRPKDFMRIVRFQRALHTLQCDPKISFAQLAAETGYYDQAHMIHEFHEFSGYTPVEYLSACAPHSDYFF